MAILAGLSWAASAIVAKIMRRRTEVRSRLADDLADDLRRHSPDCFFFNGAIPADPMDELFCRSADYSSVVSNSLAVLLWYYILHKLPAGIASLGTLATPVIGVILASIQLGERPSLWEGLGMVLIVAALALISFLGVMQYGV